MNHITNRTLSPFALAILITASGCATGGADDNIVADANADMSLRDVATLIDFDDPRVIREKPQRTARKAPRRAASTPKGAVQPDPHGGDDLGSDDGGGNDVDNDDHDNNDDNDDSYKDDCDDLHDSTCGGYDVHPLTRARDIAGGRAPRSRVLAARITIITEDIVLQGTLSSLPV